MAEKPNPLVQSFSRVVEHCSDLPLPGIRPVVSEVEGALGEVPIVLPAVDDESLKPLLLAWYYAGYYTGRYQALHPTKP